VLAIGGPRRTAAAAWRCWCATTTPSGSTLTGRSRRCVRSATRWWLKQ